MKINLIFFLSEFVAGGAANSIFRLCKNLPKKKFNVTVICLNSCSYKKELKKINVEVIEINSIKTIFGFFRIRTIIRDKLKKNKQNKTIFISNINYANVLTIIFLRKLKIKICLIERTPFEELTIYYSMLDYIKKNVIKILIYFTYHKSNVCVANSKFISEKFNQIYKLNFQTVHPPSFLIGKKINIKKNFSKSNLKIITVCRLAKEKKISELIDTVKELGDNYYLDIIGDGPDFKKLNNLIKEYDIDKKVKLLGYKQNNEIINILRKYDIYINNSDFEGFPNTVIEALSVGVPVLASQSFGGINEILKDVSFGYIYHNKLELKKYLKLIKNKKIKFNFTRKKLYNHLKKFDENINSKKYEKIFFKI